MKVRNYVALGICSFLVFLIALFPANIVWKAVDSSVGSAVPGKVQSVGGTLWKGFAVADLRAGPVNGVHVVQWDMNLLNLLMGELSLDLAVESKDFVIDGGAYIGVLGKGVDGISGNVSASLAESLLKEFGASAEGALQLNELTIAMSGDTIEDASGDIRWDGGNVKYRSGRSSQSINFPGVVGTLSQIEGALTLSLIETKGNKALGEAMLRPDGIGGIKVLQRVMTLAGLSSSPGDDDKVLVNIQRPLF